LIVVLRYVTLTTHTPHSLTPEHVELVGSFSEANPYTAQIYRSLKCVCVCERESE